MAMKKPISYLYIAGSEHLAFVAARNPPAAVSKNDSPAGRLKTDAKCGHGFSEERMQQLGYFSLFIARELRIKDVHAFQASKALRNCSMRVLKQ